MNDSHAHGAADGTTSGSPGPCIPARAAQARASGAEVGADAQQLRQLFLDLRGRIRDDRGGTRADRPLRHLSIAVDKEVYLAFQALCREHDLGVAMALQLLMSGRELPAARPVVLQLPAAVDAEALHLLHHLERSLADCQAGGAMDRGEANRFHALLAGISIAIGGTPCPCVERARSSHQGGDRREQP